MTWREWWAPLLNDQWRLAVKDVNLGQDALRSSITARGLRIHSFPLSKLLCQRAEANGMFIPLEKIPQAGECKRHCESGGRGPNLCSAGCKGSTCSFQLVCEVKAGGPVIWQSDKAQSTKQAQSRVNLSVVTIEQSANMIMDKAREREDSCACKMCIRFCLSILPEYCTLEKLKLESDTSLTSAKHCSEGNGKQRHTMPTRIKQQGCDCKRDQWQIDHELGAMRSTMSTFSNFNRLCLSWLILRSRSCAVLISISVNVRLKRAPNSYNGTRAANNECWHRDLTAITQHKILLLIATAGRTARVSNLQYVL